jgi:micrococcal nuclease
MKSQHNVTVHSPGAGPHKPSGNKRRARAAMTAILVALLATLAALVWMATDVDLPWLPNAHARRTPKPRAAVAGMLQGKVVAIADGDTLTLLVDREQHRVRLYGIDAPEKKQAFGDRSKQVLAACAFGQQATVKTHGHDRYQRVIGEVFVAGRSCNLAQVELGMAWWYRKYAAADRVIAAAEVDARRDRRGLWRDPAPVPPWDFRRARKR